MNLRWFIFKTVREACAMRKHVQRLLNAQRDILSPQAIAGVQVKIDELNAAIAEKHSGKIRIKMEELEFAANKWLKPYPHAAWRENVEVLLVALAVAMAIRTFFVQPFKIPTGSMQPTLFGVTSTPDFGTVVSRAEYFESAAASGYAINDAEKASLQAEYDQEEKLQKAIVIPTGWERVKEWFEGVSYLHVVAQADGTIDSISPVTKFLIFNIKQTFSLGGVTHTIWFPPDFGESDLKHRAGLLPGRVYHKGEDVVKIQVGAGDHLFVDRLSYNFRKPTRGEIVVFATQGIDRLPPDQQGTFYIKRLVGLGGETLSIQQDGAVLNVPRMGTVPVGQILVNGQPLTASTPHFKGLYGFISTHIGQVWNYADNQYYGHGMLQALASGNDFQVASNHCFVMGDNTMNSSDSRYWGDFPQEKIIGKSFFVYWPLTKRFGLGNE
jgi:signal peptidase I